MYYIYLFFNVVCFFYNSFMMEKDSHISDIDWYNKHSVLGLSVSSLNSGGYSTNFKFSIFGQQASEQNLMYADQEAKEASERATKIFSNNSQIGHCLLPGSMQKNIFPKGGSSGLPHAIARIFKERNPDSIIFSSGELDCHGAIGGFGEVFLKMRAISVLEKDEASLLKTLRKCFIFHDSMKNKIEIINNFFDMDKKTTIYYPANITDLQNDIEEIIKNKVETSNSKFGIIFKEFITYSAKKKNDIEEEKKDQKNFLERLKNYLEMPEYQSQLSDIVELFFETFENLVICHSHESNLKLLVDFFNYFLQVGGNVSIRSVIDYICGRTIDLDNKNQALSEVYFQFLKSIITKLEEEGKESINDLKLHIENISLYFKNINLMHLKHAIDKIAIKIENNQLPEKKILELDKEKWYQYKFVYEKEQSISSLCDMEAGFKKIYECKKDNKEFIAECLKMEAIQEDIKKHLLEFEKCLDVFFNKHYEMPDNKKIIGKIKEVIEKKGNLYHALKMIMQNNNNDLKCLIFVLNYICIKDRSILIDDINLMRGMLIQYLRRYFSYFSKANLEDTIWWVNFFSLLNYPDKDKEKEPYKDFLNLLEACIMNLVGKDLMGFLYLDHMSYHGTLPLLKNYSNNNNILFACLSQTLKIYCFNVLMDQYIRTDPKVEKDKRKMIIDNIIRVIQNIPDSNFQDALASHFVEKQYFDIINLWHASLERMLKSSSAYGTAITEDNNEICSHLIGLHKFLGKNRQSKKIE